MGPPVNRASRQDSGGRWGYCRPHFAVTAVVLILAHLALVPVHAQNTLLNQARAHMADGNPQAAYDLLRSQEASLAGDPGFDYLLGIAAMDSGHLTHSVFALERVLAVEPDNLLARAEIARVHLMLGELRTSQQEPAAGGTQHRRALPDGIPGNPGRRGGFQSLPGGYRRLGLQCQRGQRYIECRDPRDRRRHFHFGPGRP